MARRLLVKTARPFVAASAEGTARREIDAERVRTAMQAHRERKRLEDESIRKSADAEAKYRFEALQQLQRDVFKEQATGARTAMTRRSIEDIARQGREVDIAKESRRREEWKYEQEAQAKEAKRELLGEDIKRADEVRDAADKLKVALAREETKRIELEQTRQKEIKAEKISRVKLEGEGYLYDPEKETWTPGPQLLKKRLLEEKETEAGIASARALATQRQGRAGAPLVKILEPSVEDKLLGARAIKVQPSNKEIEGWKRLIATPAEESLATYLNDATPEDRNREAWQRYDDLREQLEVGGRGGVIQVNVSANPAKPDTVRVGMEDLEWYAALTARKYGGRLYGDDTVLPPDELDRVGQEEARDLLELFPTPGY